MKLCKNLRKFIPGRYGLLILFVIFLNSFKTSKLQGQELGSVSFAECIKKAKEYHPYSKDKQTINATRLAKLNNISVSWLPQLSLNAQATYQSEATKISVPIPGVNISGTPLDQYKLNLDVNQMIYDGGSLSAQKKLTEAGIEAELQQNETDIYKISDQVSNVFFYSLLLQINRDVYKTTLEDLDSKEKKIASGFRNGILMESDLNSIRVEILKSRQMLSELEMAFANSIGVLVDLTGDSSLQSRKLEVPDIVIGARDTLNRPELKLFDYQKNMLEGSKILASSQRMPRLYAFSQLGYGRPGLNMMEDDFQSYYIIGVKLQWNIWDWNKTSREKNIYSLQQEIVDSKKEFYLRNLNINCRNEQTKLKQIENFLLTDEEILILRKSITDQAEKRLQQGLITMTEYLSEYNAQIKAGLQFEVHKIQLLQTKANILIIKGLL